MGRQGIDLHRGKGKAAKQMLLVFLLMAADLGALGGGNVKAQGLRRQSLLLGKKFPLHGFPPKSGVYLLPVSGKIGASQHPIAVKKSVIAKPHSQKGDFVLQENAASG